MMWPLIGELSKVAELLISVFTTILVAIKVYLLVTAGVCTSKNKLTGKTVIVTGSNTGIGKETALDLAQRGARIILACRNLTRANEAKEEIVEATGNTNVVVKHLDLSSLKSVRQFAAEIIRDEPRLDVLINNAGIAGLGKMITEDGLEMQMQSNHLGHFLLTNLLLGLLIKTNGSRIINVSSTMHRHCTQLNVEDLNFSRHPSAGKITSFFTIYSATKLCNILFTKELARKLNSLGLLKASAPSRIINVSSKAHSFTFKLDLANLNSEIYHNVHEAYHKSKLCQILTTRHLAPLIVSNGVTVNALCPGAVTGTHIFDNSSWFIRFITGFICLPFFKNVTVNALHPGVVMTDFVRWFPPMLNKCLKFFGRLFFKTADEGAQTSIHLAVADEVATVTGEYFMDCKITRSSKLAEDMGLAKKVWEMSEKLVDLKPEERHF